MGKKRQRIHVARRSLQRYGKSLSAKTQDVMAQLIRAGKGKFVRRGSNRVSIWDLDFNGLTYRLVYDKHTKQLASVLDGQMV